jgi:hypothetical protein
MEVLPCSRVAHIERTKKPYNNDIDYYAKRNALRAAEVWMDDFKSHVYMAWNIPMTVSWAPGGVDKDGDIQSPHGGSRRQSLQDPRARARLLGGGPLRKGLHLSGPVKVVTLTLLDR